MKIEPIEDRVAVKRIEAEKRTPGGIIIPDAAQDKPQRAEVLAVGPGKRDQWGNHIPLTVQVGDLVLIGKYAGSEIELGGEPVVFVSQGDILAVLR